MEGSQLSPPLIAPVCLEEVMLCDSLAESWICLLGPVGTRTVYQVLAACGFNLIPHKTAFISLDQCQTVLMLLFYALSK